jgi:DNA-binding transcriptional regulator YdaS (Cro superfamily)
MQDTLLQTTGVQDAILAAGGQKQLALHLGVTQQLVSQWLKRGYVSINRVTEIESHFGIPRARLVNPKYLRLFTPVTFNADV